MTTHPTNNMYWLAALHLPGIGPVRLRGWLEHFGDLKKLFHATPTDWQAAGLTQKQIAALKNPDWKSAERDLIWSEKNNCQLITWEDAAYPPLLKEIYDGPILLFVKGDASLLSQTQLAMVGSRNPSVTGRALAKEFAGYLAQAGLVITSGLAMGVDTASHQGALASGGKTIAVLGTGLQHFYPPSNRKLAEEIIEKGAIISEFPPNTPPKASHFPLRNRVISGLSAGVLVVEAALRSGSLITARFAAEQGREVFAIPGSIHNPLSRGCHHLIRQGAKLAETSADILEELGALKVVVNEGTSSPPIDAKHQGLLKQIGYEITTLDAIILRSGLTAGEVCSMLLHLELEGYVANVPGGYILNPCK